MEQRQLGASGLMVPVLSLGTGTFGGGNSEFFKAWGANNADGATRLVDICLDAGLTMFDSANIYSNGQAEEILGQAIKGRRDRVLISTKGTFRAGAGPNDVGSSRYHLIQAVEASLRRLGTDYIDLYQLHGFDAKTPVEETLSTLDDLVKAGKIRYIGCSNFSGWHLMKSMAVSEKYGWSRYVAHQAYYSLIGRDFEWELMPLALDQRVGTVVWSPLGWGRTHGQDPARTAATRDESPAQSGRDRLRSAGRGRSALQSCRCAGSRRRRNRQDRTAGCAELAAAAPDGRDAHHRRAKRGAIEAESRGDRLEPHAGASGGTRRRKRHDTGVSLLAPEQLQREESFSGVTL